MYFCFTTTAVPVAVTKNILSPSLPRASKSILTPITALAPISSARASNCFKASALARIISSSNPLILPPKSFRRPAPKTFTTLITATTSPVARPLYSTIYIPGTSCIDVIIIILSSLININLQVYLLPHLK